MADFARGFRLHLRGGQVLDGTVFPSGRCLVIDDPVFGLATAAASAEELLRGYPDARIEWPDVVAVDAGRTSPTAPPQHIGNRANAEDCPACSGRPLPYPFICPGPIVEETP